MNTEQLLTNVRKKYYECKTYADEGVVKFIDSESHWETMNFKTALAKPNYFRFEFNACRPRERKSSEISVLWVNGKQGIFDQKSDFPIRDTTTKLSDLLLVADVAAAGVISQIPSIFYKAAFAPHKHLLDLADAEFVDSEVSDELPYVLRCTRFRPHDYMIWVDAEYTIRRAIRYMVWTVWSEDEAQSHLNLLLSLSSSSEMLQAPSGASYFDYRYTKAEFNGAVERIGEPP